MASFTATTTVSLLALLLTLTTFLPLLTLAQPPPPPPPSPYIQPDSVFHGWSIRSFAVSSQGPYAFINDHGTFVHGLDLSRGARDEYIYVDTTNNIQQVVASRRGNPIVATSTALIFFDDYWVPRYNVSLRSLDSRVLYWLSSSVLVDSNDYLYLLGLSANRTQYYVTILDGFGQRRDTWTLPARPIGSRPIWAMDRANNIYVQETQGTDRTLTVFSSGGVLTDTLRFNNTGLTIDAIAIASNGDIFLTARPNQQQPNPTTTLLAFDASLRARGRFSLATVADSIAQLQFDAFDNLWVLDAVGDAVLAFGRTGDLMGTLSSAAPSLYGGYGGITSMQYDRTSDSLLFSSFGPVPVAVQRIGARDGMLQQQLALPDRLSSCYDLHLQVTADGSLWLLLQCYAAGFQTEARVHQMTRAGRIQREFPVGGPVPIVASSFDFVVDPYDDRMFVAWSVGLGRFFIDYIVGYSLDGQQRVNVSLDSVIPPIQNVHSMSIAFGALQVLENDRNRLSWFDLRNGSLLATVNFPDYVYPTALVADRDGFFLAHYDEVNDGRTRTFNSSVLHFNSTGGLLGQYVLGRYTGGSVFGQLAVNEDGSRLYGYDQLYGSVAVWQVRRPRPPPQQEDVQQEEDTAAVPQIEPVSVMADMAEVEVNVEAKVLDALRTMKRRQPAPLASE